MFGNLKGNFDEHWESWNMVYKILISDLHYD